MYLMKAIINTSRKQGKVSKYIYGQFAEHLGRCIYEGLYVGEDSDIPNKNGMRTDVINALRELEIPVLRWPGGCFADDYHWRDGIGEKSERPYMVNTNWGGVVENNHFGTHEFFELCEQLGTEPYICGNVGSGSVKEMRDWIEYMTFDGDSPLANERRKNGREKPWKLKFFGVGNENWGCGGNMRPQYYCDLYRRYSTFIRNYGDEPIFRIAGGPNADDAEWTETLMQNIANATEGISLHNYTFETDWDNKGSSTCFDKNGWYSLMADSGRVESAVTLHESIMDRYDPERKIALIVDEWGNWFDVEPGTNPGFLYQQNTMRDVISAMLVLHTFHRHNDRVRMANIAQMVNVLQAMILTDGEKMVLTPTYHLFRMMKGHMDGERIDIDYTSDEIDFDGKKIPKISVSASEKDGIMTISICNVSLDEDESVEIELRDGIYASACAELLTAVNMNDCNTFDAPDTVAPRTLDVSLSDGILSLKLPKMSAAVITLK
ncbi:MAG: alpha-N-arabinofuranosidase [Oscillospiraceae bacterium]|nr:alpha-N-arabinofuranosidase [Oscillospiraceae bacterium]